METQVSGLTLSFLLSMLMRFLKRLRNLILAKRYRAPMLLWTSGLQKHFFYLDALLWCMLCFHVCTHLCFHLISNAYIFGTFENRIPFQTFEKWHNISYRYASYIKSNASDIWKTGVWFLKAFGKRIEENHIDELVIPNSTVKTRTVCRGCNVCYKIFLENGKIDFKSKIWNLEQKSRWLARI